MPFLSVQSVRRSMPNLKSGRFLYGIPRLSAGCSNHKGKTREYLKDTVFCTPTVSCNSDKVNEILGCSAEEVRQYLLENMDFSSKFNEQEKKESVPQRIL